MAKEKSNHTQQQLDVPQFYAYYNIFSVEFKYQHRRDMQAMRSTTLFTENTK